MKIETLAEQLFFTTVPVFATSADDSWSGTAFLVDLQDDADRSFPILVTNRHVVEGAASLRIGLHSSTPKRRQWRPGKGWLIEVDPSSWVAHSNPRVDIAALPAGPFLFGSDEKGRSPFFRLLGLDLFATDDRLTELDALEDVVFVGYPAGLSDSANNTPIVRRGLTATPVNSRLRELAGLSDRRFSLSRIKRESSLPLESGDVSGTKRRSGGGHTLPTTRHPRGCPRTKASS